MALELPHCQWARQLPHSSHHIPWTFAAQPLHSSSHLFSPFNLASLHSSVNWHSHCTCEVYWSFSLGWLRDYFYSTALAHSPKSRGSGQAKPPLWLLASPVILKSLSRLTPGQSQGFRAKLKPAHHYQETKNGSIRRQLPIQCVS